MIPLVISEVRRLSQEEGLFDHEIAKELHISRVTVNRIRHAHNIPKVNLRFRKDKECQCVTCEHKFLVRRNQRKSIYCPVCRVKYNELLKIKRSINDSRRRAEKRAIEIQKLKRLRNEINYYADS